MAARASVLTKSLRALLILAGLGMLMLGYLYVRLTAEVRFPGAQTPTAFDAQEAARKLRLFQEARAASKKGFVRLTEVELNAYLQSKYLGGFDRRPLPETASRHGVRECRADLDTNAVDWYCWVRLNRWSQEVDLCWVRRFSLARADGRWTLELHGMRIGEVDIPARYWEKVQTWLAAADALFAEDCSWLAELPAVELRPNEFSRNPELRLYTYPEPAAMPVPAP
jgi:hypothetical protein